MIQKPALKNGQKYVHDATSKTSSAESQQQQQRKVERASHVQDLAKQPSGPGLNGNGGYHHFANHGAASSHVENGRGHQANGVNGVAPAQAVRNGYQGRPNGYGNGHPAAKPSHAASGNAVPARPQHYGFTSSAAKPGIKPTSQGSGGVNSAGVDVHQPIMPASGAHASAMQSASGGSRGRDAGPIVGPYPANGATAAGNNLGGTAGPDGDAGGRAREPRRRGGRGRGGGAGGDGPATAADAGPGDGDVEGGAPGSFAERQEKSGRPRGGRRQRGGVFENADAEGGAVGESAGDVALHAADAPEQGDTGRFGQRSGRARGRRGRGGLQVAVAGDGEQGDVAAEQQRVAARPQQATDAADQLQERKPRQQRQRPVKEPKAPRAQPEQDGVPHSAVRDQLQPADAELQQVVSSKPQRPRKVKEPRPPPSEQQLQVQRQRPQGPEASEQDGPDVARGGGRGQGRGGKRRNGGGADATGADFEVIPGAPTGQVDGDIALGGRRQRPPRPPRQQQASPPVDQPPPMQIQQPIEPPPAPPASQLRFQHPPPPPPMQASHVLQQQQQPLVQQLQPYQQPQFQGGQSLLDYPSQLLQHMVPQQPYPPAQDYHQQHFVQHQQQQFEHNFQQFEQHQLMHQHLSAPAPPSGHEYLAGPFNAPGGPNGGQAPMPTFYAPVSNGYGQMLPPPPPLPVFGGAPTPPVAQPDAPALAPFTQHPSVGAPAALPHELQHQLLQQLQGVHLHSQMVPQLTAEEPLAAPQQPVAAALEVAAVPSLVAPETTVVVPDPVEEAPNVEPVKNEWADRLAQQALARMNAVKSNLISGLSSSSEGLIGADERPRGRPSSYSTGAGHGPGPHATSPRVSSTIASGGVYATEPETWRGYGDSDIGVRRNVSAAPASEAWRNGPSSVAPVVDPANGWRASLAPTGAADAAEAWRLRAAADEAETVQAPAPYQPPRREESPPPPTAAAGAAAGRPRLNLQPRTKPAPPPPGPASAPVAPIPAPPPANGDGPTTNGPGIVARASIFGAARPREEVLRGRGQTEPERLTAGNVAYTNGTAAGGGSARGGGRAGSVTSGASDDDQWLTVGKGGRSKPPPGSADVGNAVLDATSDPFFTGRATTGHGVAIVGRSIPTGRVYGVNGGHFGGGSHGKGSNGSHGGDTYMNAFGASRGYGNSYGNDDEPIFKRGLPTRNDDPF